MNIDELKGALEEYLCPLLSAKLKGDLDVCMPGRGRTAYLSPTDIAVRADPSDTSRVVMHRIPAFTSQEKKVAECFVEELVGLYKATAEEYRKDILKSLSTRAIARYLGSSVVVGDILRNFEYWSSRTYEGGSVVSSIGLDVDVDGGGDLISDIFSQDFSSVLTNGFDSILVFGGNGRLQGYENIELGGVVDKFAPNRISAISEWSNGGRISFVLNRRGEQLVFKGGQLIFAKRRGEWQYYEHEVYLKRMPVPRDMGLRRSIYQTCLDVSFARTGGCIVVVAHGMRDSLKGFLSDADRFDGGSGIRVSVLSKIIGVKFQDIDRRLRQQVLAMDGAAVIDYLGTVIALGAILNVAAGSAGGRTAAAMRGSYAGLGIKISEDGAIVAYKDGDLIFSF